MAITASAVKELRERTGAGMMDSKKALQETGGDLEAAQRAAERAAAIQPDQRSTRRLLREIEQLRRESPRG